MSAKEIDKIICEWSMDNGVPLTDKSLNDLVEMLCELLGIDWRAELT